MKINELVSKVSDSEPTLFANKENEKQAASILKHAFKIILDEINTSKGEVVNVGGFGRFKLREVKSKKNEGEMVEIVRFVPYTKTKKNK